jgi:uncharacterized membrane protein
MKSSASLLVNKPIDEVFAYIARLENMEQWADGVSQVQMISQGDVRLGTTFRSKYTYAGKTHNITYEVTTYEAPHRFGLRSTSGPFPFEGLVELEAMNGKTHIIYTIDAGSDSFATTLIFTLFRPFIRRAMSKQILKELEILKSKLE